MKGNTVEWINTLGAFCGVRDVPTLTKDALEQKYGFRQADVMVLFGGSILCGGNVLAEAMKNQAAKKYVIVGGAGHTTAVSYTHLDVYKRQLRRSLLIAGAVGLLRK